MTIRRKRRQRGKRKALRREALKTWARLVQTATPPREYDPLAGIGVILPLIRNIMPNTIAQDIVGVQPMTAPTGMFGDSASGIEPVTVRYRHGNRTKKEISEQRKKERKEKKRGGPTAIAKRYGLDSPDWDDIKFKIDTVG